MDISEKELVSRIAEMNPRRGEVYRVEIIDAKGYGQKGDDDGVRLVVVVSNNQQNAKKNVIVIVPLSSKVRKIYPFQVPRQSHMRTSKSNYYWAIWKEVRRVNRKRNEWDWGEVGFCFTFRRSDKKESSSHSSKVFKVK